MHSRKIFRLKKENKTKQVIWKIIYQNYRLSSPILNVSAFFSLIRSNIYFTIIIYFDQSNAKNGDENSRNKKKIIWNKLVKKVSVYVIVKKLIL